MLILLSSMIPLRGIVCFCEPDLCGLVMHGMVTIYLYFLSSLHLPLVLK